MPRKAVKTRWSTFTDNEMSALRKALYDFIITQSKAYSDASRQLFTQVPIEYFGIETLSHLKNEIQDEINKRGRRLTDGIRD